MKANCTWGDGPDVLLEFDGSELLIYDSPVDFHHTRNKHGVVCHGSLSLTIIEAENLANELFNSAAEARRLNDEISKLK